MNEIPAIGLKEWASAVEALIAGDQSVVFRKGGIVEPHGEFVPEHKSFLLYPAREHQKPELIKPQFLHYYDQTAETLSNSGFVVNIASMAVVLQTAIVNTFDELPTWANHHIWTDEFIKIRLNYKPEKPLFVMQLQVKSLETPIRFTESLEQAGCKSWVPVKL